MSNRRDSPEFYQFSHEDEEAYHAYMRELEMEADHLQALAEDEYYNDLDPDDIPW